MEFSISIDVISDDDLSSADLQKLRRMFDREYAARFGPWDRHQPYGYSGHDVHIIARSGDDVVGHVGWARRVIGVGNSDVTVAGVGGVLVTSHARGDRWGSRLMSQAAGSMADAGGVDFGYLGCREEVVPFYSSCGWHRISAAERSTSRAGVLESSPSGPPLLILPVNRGIASWPPGTIDLRGRAW